MKITIIGAGNMGGALALGLFATGRFEITVTALHSSSLERFRKLGMAVSTDNNTAVKGSDIVFFAVKPWLMEEVSLRTAPSLDLRSQMVVSIAPGVTPAQLVSWFSDKARIAYAIPNTAVEIGRSMTYLSPVTATAEQMNTLKSVFDRVGTCRIVDKSLMLSGTSLASCGIAYAMRYISASAKGGAALGLDPATVVEDVCQTVLGAAALISAHSSDPEREIDKVTTPGGLTLRGLAAMEKGGFSQSVADGLYAVRGKKGRIVIKVGSNVLTRDDGALDITRVSSLVDQMVKIRRAGYEIVLVSSGAVACGRSLVREDDKLDEVQQRQLYSSLGQVRLMDLYYKLFSNYGINVGQILTMKKNFATKKEYMNQLGCMDVMFKSGVLPVVNENDTVSITELMFTDNDELSGLVASMVKADMLIILTNVDGLYDGKPGEKGVSLIPVVKPGDNYSDCLSKDCSSRGRGGMDSKCSVASKVASGGIRVLIANGKRENILAGLVEDPAHTVHTEFIPVQK